MTAPGLFNKRNRAFSAGCNLERTTGKRKNISQGPMFELKPSKASAVELNECGMMTTT